MHAKPVFVDSSGRRRRLLRRGGIAAGIAIAGFLAVMGFGIINGAATPLTPWVGGPSHAAEKPAPSHHPSRTPSPSTGGTSPRPHPDSPTAARGTSSVTSGASSTASASATATRGRGNATRTPPGLAKKTRSP